MSEEQVAAILSEQKEFIVGLHSPSEEKEYLDFQADLGSYSPEKAIKI